MHSSSRVAHSEWVRWHHPWGTRVLAIVVVVKVIKNETATLRMLSVITVAR